jgi:Bifunctional DNA primase/polymerase, N-terminal
MRRPLGSIDWFSGAEHQTLHEVLLMAEESWQLYPIYGVDADGVCACPKGATCPNPGKHPTTPRGFNDASSDPKRIAEIFARWPGDNVGHRLAEPPVRSLSTWIRVTAGWRPWGGYRPNTDISRQPDCTQRAAAEFTMRCVIRKA